MHRNTSLHRLCFMGVVSYCSSVKLRFSRLYTAKNSISRIEKEKKR